MSREKLYEAIINHDEKELLYLLQTGLEVNVPSHNGVVPLFHAICAGNTKMVTILLDAGADPAIRNHLGYNALHLAAMCEDWHLFYELVRHSSKDIISAVDCRGNTILHLAASCHNFTVVKICLAYTEVDLNVQNIDGETAFFRAIKNDDFKIALLLLKHGCDANLADQNGISPAMMALDRYKVNAETIAFIVEKCKRSDNFDTAAVVAFFEGYYLACTENKVGDIGRMTRAVAEWQRRFYRNNRNHLSPE